GRADRKTHRGRLPDGCTPGPVRGRCAERPRSVGGRALARVVQACLDVSSTKSWAGRCPVSSVPLVSVSSPAVVCFFPCLSCHPCLPCSLFFSLFDASGRVSVNRRARLRRGASLRRHVR